MKVLLKLTMPYGWPQWVRWLFAPLENCAQAPVVQRVDSTIHWINQQVLIVLIRWILIYTLDSITK